MPRSTVYPYRSNGFQRSFNQGATYPTARYESDDEENELDRARELYKNLQGSPGGWQTRALQGQSQQLKRRLQEGEDARSLLGSQLDESRTEYGGLQRRYGDLESQVNQKNRDREEKRRAFQEAYDKDYIEKQLLPVIQKHYSLSNYPGFKDLESLAEYRGSGYKPGMTGEAYKKTWDHPNYQHVYKQFPAYQPPEYPQKMDLYSLYGGLKTDYDNLQKRNSETESLYQGRMADFKRHQEEHQKQFNKYIHKPEFADQILRKKYNLEKGLYDLTMQKSWPDVKKYADEQGYKGNYQKYGGEYVSGAPQQKPFMSYEDFENRNHNKAFMTSLMPQFEAKYPQGDRTEAEHLANLGYNDPTYAKDPVSFLKQYKKYYPFANEETYQKYHTVDRFRDLSPASKQYLNIDQPNFKNFNKISEQKLKDQESMAASELQSQMERMSESYDNSMDHFANLLKEQNPQRYNEIMSDASQTPRFSQMSRYSSIAPSSFANSIRSGWDSERQRGRARETDLKQLTGRYDEEREKHNQWVRESEEKQNKLGGDVKRLTGDALLKDAELQRLRARDQEYTNYRREVSPLRREHPVLKKFRQDYNHVNLNEYAKIPAMRQTLQNAPREAAALYKDAVDFYNSRHRNSYGKDYPGTISWGKKFGLL